MNFAGLRIPAEQRQITSSLPMHLVDVLNVGDNSQTFADGSGIHCLLLYRPVYSSCFMLDYVA